MPGELSEASSAWLLSRGVGVALSVGRFFGVYSVGSAVTNFALCWAPSLVLESRPLPPGIGDPLRDEEDSQKLWEPTDLDRSLTWNLTRAIPNAEIPTSRNHSNSIESLTLPRLILEIFQNHPFKITPQRLDLYLSHNARKLHQRDLMKVYFSNTDCSPPRHPQHVFPPPWFTLYASSTLRKGFRA